MQALRPLQRYFEFGGRSGRAEFWQFFALYIVVASIALVVDFSSDSVSRYGGTPTLTLIIVAIGLIPSYAVAFRRLHDVGHSGWWIGALALLSVVQIVLQALTNEFVYTPSEAMFRTMTIAARVISLGVSGYALYQVCRRGDPDANRFGPPPSIAQTATAPGAGTGVAGTPSTPSFLTKLGQGDPLAQIERLSKLRSEGALTDDEFAAHKAELLKRL